MILWLFYAPNGLQNALAYALERYQSITNELPPSVFINDAEEEPVCQVKVQRVPWVQRKHLALPLTEQHFSLWRQR